jgi:hypothetical protein
MYLLATNFHCRINNYRIPFFGFFIFCFFSNCINKSITVKQVVKIKTLIQLPHTNNILTVTDSTTFLFGSNNAVIYEKFESKTYTQSKYTHNDFQDTVLSETVLTGEDSTYYFAYFRGNKKGYLFSNLNDLDNFRIADVDSVDKTTAGMNKFSIDSILINDNIKKVNEITSKDGFKKRIEYSIANAGDDGDSIYLEFDKTNSMYLSIAPETDKINGMTLTNFVVIMNSKWSLKNKLLLPRREFRVSRNDIPISQNQTKRVRYFLKKFEKNFQ